MNPAKREPDQPNGTPVTSFWTLVYKLFIWMLSKEGIQGLIALVAVCLVSWVLIEAVWLGRAKSAEWIGHQMQMEKDASTVAMKHADTFAKNAATNAEVAKAVTKLTTLADQQTMFQDLVTKQHADLQTLVAENGKRLGATETLMKDASRMMEGAPSRGERTVALLTEIAAEIKAQGKNQQPPVP